MRLFVALNLPAQERQRIAVATAELQRAAPSVRWVSTDSLHITLKFLGEARDEQLGGIERALGAAASDIAPFTIELRGLGAFPNARRPRVFWLGTEAPPALGRLRDNVERGTAPLGFPTEARAFHPHLTLGRVREPIPAAESERLARAGEQLAYHARVPIGTVDLMRSHLSPRGARYEALLRVPLAGSVAEGRA